MCSDDPTLQHYGASILTLPNLSSNEMQSAELAKHKNPSVRCVGVNMAASQACPAAKVFEQLSLDPDREVRIAVAQALPSVQSIDPGLYEHIRERLKSDPSVIVRACASMLPT